MADWELYDGKTISGPFSEEALVDIIRRGMPATVLVRQVGTTDWVGFRSHPPFAMALEQARSAQAAVAPPPPNYAPPPQQVVVQSNPATEGCFSVLWIVFLAGLVLFLGTCAFCTFAVHR